MSRLILLASGVCCRRLLGRFPTRLRWPGTEDTANDEVREPEEHGSPSGRGERMLPVPAGPESGILNPSRLGSASPPSGPRHAITNTTAAGRITAIVAGHQ
jgi:hypothetical protein